MFPFQTQHYIHHRDHHYVFFHYFHVTNKKKRVILINLQKIDPCKTWVKISKVMPQVPNSIFPQEREGSLTAKSPNLLANIWYGLTVHICFFIFKIYKQKFFKIYILSFGKISSELYKIRAIFPRIPWMMQNSHHLLIHYTLCFQMPDHWQRTFWNSSKSSEIRSIRPWIPRITWISH